MVKTRLTCNLCNSRKFKKLYTDISDYESFIDIKTDLVICTKCQLIQQSKIFSTNEIKNFYLEDYHGRNYTNKTILGFFSSLLRKRYYKRFISYLNLISQKKDLNILDYGSGDGFLCKELFKNGYKNIYSCDFFKPKAINKTIHIFPNELKNYNNFFDVIFMINSIEHLSSFFKDFRKIELSSKERSILIIETPNFNSFDSYLFRKYWGGLHQPRHTFLWSEKSLCEHLSNWNYVSKSFNSPQSAHWAISVQNVLSARFKFFKYFLKNGRIPGYLILVIFFLPISIIQNYLKKGSVLNILSWRKERKRS